MIIVGILEETYKNNYEPPVIIKYARLSDYNGINCYISEYPVDIEDAYKHIFKALEYTHSFVSINICGELYYIKDNYGDINDDIYESVLDSNSKIYKKYRLEYKMNKD